MEGETLVAASWTLGLLFIVLTVAFHTTAVVMMAFVGTRIRVRVEKQNPHQARVIVILIRVIAAVAVILAILHGLESMLWAAAYLWLGAFSSYVDALLYALGTMTSSSTVEVGSRWHMVSALEAMDGALLFGISTAFIFTVMQDYWPMLSRGRPETP
ncbi:hypothetical protein [Mycobacterium sp.]|uniref:hypothetical protein n=1 Tax=Mycobacterium sp. TaxID=1785 RepID=UPI003C781B30